MNRAQAIQAIVNAADDGGTIQAEDMLSLTRRGALPNDPTLHTAMSIESALRAAGLDDAEVEALLDA